MVLMYGYKKEVSMGYDEALEKVRAELGEEGFGILTEIDVQATLKKKLDVDVDKYIILGACNPPAAHKALQAEQDIGLMLPCNVIVYEKEGKVFVSAIRPSVAMAMIDNPDLAAVAQGIEMRLKSVIDMV